MPIRCPWQGCIVRGPSGRIMWPSEWAAGGRAGDQDGSAHKDVIDCGALGSIDWHWLPWHVGHKRKGEQEAQDKQNPNSDGRHGRQLSFGFGNIISWFNFLTTISMLVLQKFPKFHLVSLLNDFLFDTKHWCWHYHEHWGITMNTGAWRV